MILLMRLRRASLKEDECDHDKEDTTDNDPQRGLDPT